MKNKDVPYAVATGNKNAITAISVLAFSLMLSNIFFAWIWSVEYAKKEKIPEPIIFEVDKASHQIVRIERGGLNRDERSVIRSFGLRGYVIDRETINHVDDMVRWQNVKLKSSGRVFEEFNNIMNPDINPESIYLDKNFTRSVEIITEYPIDRNTHRIEFYITDAIKGEEKPPQRYVAVIKYDNSQTRVLYKNQYLNLDGLRVTGYSIRNLH